MKKLIKGILKEENKGTYHRSGDVEEWRINPYEMETTDYKELLSKVNELPDTIESIDIPIEVSLFNPQKKSFTPSEDNEWRKKIKDIVLAMRRRGNIKSYSINSFFGTTSKNYDKHPYYISFELPLAKEFGERMSSGYYGSLD